MTSNPVHFGTDGWRAIIGEEFTFDNVRACAQASADHFTATYGKGKPLVVGFDTRFSSDEFALVVARILAGNGFHVQLSDRAAPTPAFSYRIIQEQGAGGVIVTSSHNPYRWDGIKLKPHYGGSADPAFVQAVEDRIPFVLQHPDSIKLAPADSKNIVRFNPVPGYLDGLRRQVDVDRLKSAGLKVAVDPMYGTGTGLLAELLDGGSTKVTEIHTERNPLFPGIHAPEPIEQNLGDFLSMIAHGDFDAGIATDGDADRVGVVDEHGVYVDQLRTFALLVNYLLGERGLRGPVIKSVTTTSMAKTLAEHYGVPIYETPVGFKYIGPLMIEHDALIGGEESGGYGFRGHLPERDGTLAGLFLLDAVAATGKRPSELLKDVFAITGPHFYQRLDFSIEPGTNAQIKSKLDAAKPKDIAGHAVVSHDQTDGWRWFIDGGWLLLRLSGTEPLLRIYTEVNDEKLVKPVLDAGKALAEFGG